VIRSLEKPLVQAPRRPALAYSLFAALLLAGCAYSPEDPLLGPKWAAVERLAMDPRQRGFEESSVSITWSGGEGCLEDADDAPKGSTVTAKIAEGSFALADEAQIHDRNVVIEGLGPDRSRLVLDGGPAGFVLKGGKLKLRDLTISSFSCEGLTVLGGDVEMENVVINGATHGLHIARGRAHIKNSAFVGNEVGISLGEGAKLSLENCILARNWVAIAGEEPKLLKLVRCMIAANKHRALPLRLNEDLSMKHSIIADNRLGWKGYPELGKIESSLLPPEAFDRGRIRRGGNRSIDHLESFPGAVAGGLPKGFPVATHMLLRRRGEIVGRGRAESRLRDFAKDEAMGCVLRADELVRQEEFESAEKLLAIAVDFGWYYPSLRKKLGARMNRVSKRLETARRAKDARRGKARMKAPAKGDLKARLGGRPRKG